MNMTSESNPLLVALVTGGAKGFGAGITDELVSRGFEVFITGRDATALESKKSDKVHPLVADATVPEDWDRVFKTILDKYGKLDALVNNAGGGVRIANLEDQTDADIEQSIALNLTSALYGCRRAAAVMRKQGSGAIVNVSSVCSRYSWPGWGVYGAAKAGMENFSRSLHLELRPYGVRVTTVVPSWGATEFNSSAQISAFNPETSQKCIQPRDLGKIVADICTLPAHLWIQETVLLPLIQEINPL